MKVTGLDNKEYSWSIWGKSSDSEQKSSYHLKARALLKKLFPIDRILEEVYLPGCDSLYADFFLPLRKIIVEVHGEQHYKYIPFFHGNKLNFFKAQARDRNKRLFCEKNGILYIDLPCSESEDEWRNRILECKL